MGDVFLKILPLPLTPYMLQSQVLHAPGKKKAKRKQPTSTSTVKRVGQEMLGKQVQQPIAYYTKSKALRWLDVIRCGDHHSP